MNGSSNIVGVITAIIVVLIIILIALIAVVFLYIYKNKKRQSGEAIAIKNNKISGTTIGKTTSKGLPIESMSKFLDFDEIVDSMIVRKNRQQYVMVIHCKGVNFDLLGRDEKLAVENGFTQFLNTLKFPIQLYIQTKSLNLRNNVEQYKARVEEVKQEIAKIEAQIRKEQASGRLDLVRKLEFEKRRKENILEYGLDITDYVDRLSQNRDVLQQNTYVVVSYYASEFGGEIQNYSKEEIDSIAFSELYTRAQTLIAGLSSAAVTGRVINSEELAELLFVAYNRDESELLNMRKMVEQQYDSLYHTGKDILEKQKELIEEKVNEEAINLAAESITKADKILKFKKDNEKEIKTRAVNYLNQYKDDMIPRLYNETVNQINTANITGEEEKIESVEAIKNTEKQPQKKKKPLTEEQKRILLERKRRKMLEERRKMNESLK